MYAKKSIAVKQQYLSFFLTIAASFFWGQEVHATSWFDYAQSTGSVGITSTSTDDATVLLVKSGTCPKNGWLVVTGSGNFHGYPSDVSVTYSLTRDAIAPYAVDFAHFGSIREPVFGPGDPVTFDMPFSIQRIDTCTQGQTISYRLVAAITQGIPDETAVDRPRLVIEFFDVRI